MRRLILLLLAVALLLVGCGGSNAKHVGPVATIAPCPAAADGHGSMGACAPRREFPRAVPPPAAGAITFPDRSNNNPTLSLAALYAAGHPAIYLKVNQGTGFVDRWFAPMAAAARKAGMAVGGYDFVATYSTAEAHKFVALLRAAGVTRRSARTMPPVLDVEYAAASRAGVQAMVDVVRAAFGRVVIYTGAWYWTPRLGCWWPSGVKAWLSGYPSAPVPCGVPAEAWMLHQYTDRGWDGVGNVDMNRWLRSPAAFRVFARTGPSRHQLRRRLRGQVRWRDHLRRVLHKHGCYAHRHRARPVNCVLVLARGDAANRRIRSIRHQIKEQS